MELSMLLSRGKITRDLMVLIRSRRHSGFQVYVDPRIQPGEEEASENLAQYIIRTSFHVFVDLLEVSIQK